MRRPGRSTTLTLVVAAVCVSASVLTGCFTGERPSFGTGPTAVGVDTGDVSIDAVLALLDDHHGAVFTAQYTATVPYDQQVTTAVTITQAAANRRSVTIGDTRYLSEPTTTRTCGLASGICVPGIDAQPVSNTGVSPDIAFGAAATRLRSLAGSRIGPTTGTTSTIAGQPATCVDVPLPNGTATYCALSTGIVARIVDGDVVIEMTSYAPSVDESLFTPPAVVP